MASILFSTVTRYTETSAEKKYNAQSGGLVFSK